MPTGLGLHPSRSPTPIGFHWGGGAGWNRSIPRTTGMTRLARRERKGEQQRETASFTLRGARFCGLAEILIRACFSEGGTWSRSKRSGGLSLGSLSQKIERRFRRERLSGWFSISAAGQPGGGSSPGQARHRPPGPCGDGTGQAQSAHQVPNVGRLQCRPNDRAARLDFERDRSRTLQLGSSSLVLRPSRIS